MRETDKHPLDPKQAFIANGDVNEEGVELLLGKDNWNSYMIFAAFNPKRFEELMSTRLAELSREMGNFVREVTPQYPDADAEGVQALIKVEADDLKAGIAKDLIQISGDAKWNALMLASRYSADSVKSITRIMKDLTPDQQAQILCQKDEHGWTALDLAEVYQPEALRDLIPALGNLLASYDELSSDSKEALKDYNLFSYPQIKAAVKSLPEDTKLSPELHTIIHRASIHKLTDREVDAHESKENPNQDDFFKL